MRMVNRVDPELALFPELEQAFQDFLAHPTTVGDVLCVGLFSVGVVVALTLLWCSMFPGDDRMQTDTESDHVFLDTLYTIDDEPIDPR